MTPRGAARSSRQTVLARRLSLYRAPAIFLHICISVSVSLVCTDDETDKGEGLGRRDDMQRDESCSTFILTTQVLPAHRKTPLSPSHFVSPYSYLFWNRCRPDGGPAEVVARRLALRDDRHSLRGHLPPQIGSEERAGERERAHFTTRWRRRKSPHLELLLLPRLFQICPRPLRGGHVRQEGTGRRGGGGTKTKREERTKTE